jgi:hypothetical protein
VAVENYLFPTHTLIQQAKKPKSDWKQFARRRNERKLSARRMHKLKHGCTHDVWAQKDISIGGEVLATIDPVVRIANDDDSFYVQTFTTRDEVEKFISEIRQAADEAWGEK